MTSPPLPPIVRFLRARLAEEDERPQPSLQRLADVRARHAIYYFAFKHASDIDAEFGCCCSAVQIEAGRCHRERPEDIDVIRWLAFMYHTHPEWDPVWQPDPHPYPADWSDRHNNPEEPAP